MSMGERELVGLSMQRSAETNKLGDVSIMSSSIKNFLLRAQPSDIEVEIILEVFNYNLVKLVMGKHFIACQSRFLRFPSKIKNFVQYYSSYTTWLQQSVMPSH